MPSPAKDPRSGREKEKKELEPKRERLSHLYLDLCKENEQRSRDVGQYLANNPRIRDRCQETIPGISTTTGNTSSPPSGMSITTADSHTGNQHQRNSFLGVVLGNNCGDTFESASDKVDVTDIKTAQPSSKPLLYGHNDEYQDPSPQSGSPNMECHASFISSARSSAVPISPIAPPPSNLAAYKNR